jgi:hypothetical protein
LVVAKADVEAVEMQASGKKSIIFSVGKEQPSNKTDAGAGK